MEMKSNLNSYQVKKSLLLQMIQNVRLKLVKRLNDIEDVLLVNQRRVFIRNTEIVLVKVIQVVATRF